MALYAIGDLHLSLKANKPMDKFGGVWLGYMEKIERNLAGLNKDDVIILCGDTSWGLGLNESLPDFEFLDRMPGKKIILKGNHDYWWSTVTKMKSFLADNNIFSIEFLFNNCFSYEGTAICGTRGWFYEENMEAGDEKVLRREILRLETSLKAADGAEEIYCFLHYPPLYDGYRCKEILELLTAYKVNRCYFGHLHDKSHRLVLTGKHNGVEYHFISADYLNFVPVLIKN